MNYDIGTMDSTDMGVLSPEKLYTVESLAKALGLKDSTIIKHAQSGDLPSIKKYRRYYFLGKDVIRHINDTGKKKGTPSDWE